MDEQNEKTGFWRRLFTGYPGSGMWVFMAQSLPFLLVSYGLRIPGLRHELWNSIFSQLALSDSMDVWWYFSTGLVRAILYFVVSVAMVWTGYFIALHRARRKNIPPWQALFYTIPILDVVAFFYLLVWPDSRAGNEPATSREIPVVSTTAMKAATLGMAALAFLLGIPDSEELMFSFLLICMVVVGVTVCSGCRQLPETSIASAIGACILAYLVILSSLFYIGSYYLPLMLLLAMLAVPIFAMPSCIVGNMICSLADYLQGDRARRRKDLA